MQGYYGQVWSLSSWNSLVYLLVIHPSIHSFVFSVSVSFTHYTLSPSKYQFWAHGDDQGPGLALEEPTGTWGTQAQAQITRAQSVASFPLLTSLPPCLAVSESVLSAAYPVTSLSVYGRVAVPVLQIKKLCPQKGGCTGSMRPSWDCPFLLHLPKDTSTLATSQVQPCVQFSRPPP